MCAVYTARKRISHPVRTGSFRFEKFRTSPLTRVMTIKCEIRIRGVGENGNLPSVRATEISDCAYQIEDNVP